jgi:hypothetical protein
MMRADRDARRTSSIAASEAGCRTVPAYSARAQWARSTELPAMSPASPAAVTTDAYGEIAVPSDSLILRAVAYGPMSWYDVATVPRRVSIPWEKVRLSASGSRKRRRISVAAECPVTFRTSWPRIT